MKPISGKLRRYRGSSGQQYKIGKVEEENKQVSAIDAELQFPGSVAAWCEVALDLYPELEPNSDIFNDPKVLQHRIKNASVFFVEKDRLTVAAKEAPQLALMYWDPQREDWFDAVMA